MGQVYRAQHTFLGTSHAVKVLTPRVSRNRAAVGRFLREAQTVATIAHEQVVRVSDGDFLPDTDQAYFVMELLDGEDLQATLAAGALPWPRVRRIMLQICATVAAIHRRGIIHRDLKPANCFRVSRHGNDDYIMLVDFGLAKLIQPEPDQLNLSEVDPILGTPSYAAPEQLANREVDQRADVWSAGATLYHLLTGSPPFSADSLMDLMLAVANTRPMAPSLRAPLGTVPNELDVVISRALARDPGERYPTMDELHDALAAIPDELPRTTPKPPELAKTDELAFAATLLGEAPTPQPAPSPQPVTPTIALSLPTMRVSAGMSAQNAAPTPSLTRSPAAGDPLKESFNAHGQLARFFADAFASEMHPWLIQNYEPDVLYNVPGKNAPVMQIASSSIEVLARRGLINDEFFERLKAARPYRSDEIENLALLWRHIRSTPTIPPGQPALQPAQPTISPKQPTIGAPQDRSPPESPEEPRTAPKIWRIVATVVILGGAIPLGYFLSQPNQQSDRQVPFVSEQKRPEPEKKNDPTVPVPVELTKTEKTEPTKTEKTEPTRTEPTKTEKIGPTKTKKPIPKDLIATDPAKQEPKRVSIAVRKAKAEKCVDHRLRMTVQLSTDANGLITTATLDRHEDYKTCVLAEFSGHVAADEANLSNREVQLYGP